MVVGFSPDGFFFLEAASVFLISINFVVGLACLGEVLIGALAVPASELELKGPVRPAPDRPPSKTPFSEFSPSVPSNWT